MKNTVSKQQIKDLTVKILLEELNNLRAVLSEEEKDDEFKLDVPIAKLKKGDKFMLPSQNTEESDATYEVIELTDKDYIVKQTVKGDKNPIEKKLPIKKTDKLIEDGDFVIIKGGDSTKTANPKEPENKDKPDSDPEQDSEQDDQQDDQDADTKEKGSSAWEKVKYVLAKVGGRYKVNGKIFGKRKIRDEEREKIKTLLDKTSNKILKDIDNKIKETYKEFPNNEKGADFLSGVEQIASVYDTIVQKTSKEAPDQIPVDAANEMINDLRDYVKNLLDVELKAFYATVDEQHEHEEYMNMLLEDAASDLRAKLQAARKERSAQGDTADFKSSKIDTLKSNKLPLTLAGVGASFGAFSWLVNTEWFKSLFDVATTENYTELVKEASTQLTDIKENEGVYKLLSRVTDTKLDGNSSPQQFVDVLKQIGGGDANKGVDLLCQKGGVMMKPEEASQGLKEFLKNPNQYKNVGELFTGQASGTGKLVPTDTTLYGTISGRQLTTVVLKLIPKIFTKTAIKTGAGYAVAKGLGNVLGPIGIGLLIAGATVKLMRAKGLKTSRAATLNSLYQSLRNIPGGEIVNAEGPVNTEIKVDPIVVPPAPKGAKDTEGPVFIPFDSETGDTGTKDKGAAAASSDEKDKEKAEPGKEKAPETPASKEGEKEKEGEKGVEEKSKQDYDKLYKILKSTFRYIGDNKTNLYSPTKKITEAFLVEERYIKSTAAYEYIADKVGIKKLQAFENVLRKIEAVKSAVNNMPKGVDPKLDDIINDLRTNPLNKIVFTDFLNITYSQKPEQERQLNNLVDFINFLFDTIYKKTAAKENLVDKAFSMATEKVKEAKQSVQTNKIRKDLAVKTNKYGKNVVRYIITFLLDSYKLFKYLHNMKKGGDSAVKAADTAKDDTSSVSVATTVTAKDMPKKSEKKKIGIEGSVYQNQKGTVKYTIQRVMSDDKTVVYTQSNKGKEEQKISIEDFKGLTKKGGLWKKVGVKKEEEPTASTKEKEVPVSTKKVRKKKASK